MVKRNRELAFKFSQLDCMVCGSPHQVSGHHIISFGSRPDLDIEKNIIPLCWLCHREVHDNGLVFFVKKHGLENFLINRGFHFNAITRKWYLPVQESLI